MASKKQSWNSFRHMLAGQSFSNDDLSILYQKYKEGIIHERQLDIPEILREHLDEEDEEKVEKKEIKNKERKINFDYKKLEDLLKQKLPKIDLSKIPKTWTQFTGMSVGSIKYYIKEQVKSGGLRGYIDDFKIIVDSINEAQTILPLFSKELDYERHEDLDSILFNFIFIDELEIPFQLYMELANKGYDIGYGGLFFMYKVFKPWVTKKMGFDKDLPFKVFRWMVKSNSFETSDIKNMAIKIENERMLPILYGGEEALILYERKYTELEEKYTELEAQLAKEKDKCKEMTNKLENKILDMTYKPGGPGFNLALKRRY